MITGPDRGKTGKVFKVLRKRNQVLVEGVNIVHLSSLSSLSPVSIRWCIRSDLLQTKRHIRPGQPRESEDQKYWFAESPVHYSNVSHIHPETKKPVKVGFAYLDGDKVRVVRGTDIVIPKPPPPDKDEKRKRGSQTFFFLLLLSFCFVCFSNVSVGPKDTASETVLRQTFDPATLNPLLVAHYEHKTWELDTIVDEEGLGEE